MFTHTLPSLRCPKQKSGNTTCGGELALKVKTERRIRPDLSDVVSGELSCKKCHSPFPILAGVAVLVADVREYLLSHVKGITQIVPDSDIPKAFLREFLAAKEELETEHIEEDLEAERVTALYLMNHYLTVAPGDFKPEWWKADHGTSSPLIDELVRRYWDQGPFAKITEWMKELHEVDSLIELGCGVGGLYQKLKAHTKSYLGVDSSFASIALARHLSLGAPYPKKPKIPRDLLHGSVAADPALKPATTADGTADFIVGDLETLPVAHQSWSMTIALNAIDMLYEPALLPRLQFALLKKGGLAIQSGPYIWHTDVAAKIRKKLPKDILESAHAVRWLYTEAGFQIETEIDHVPWLFFKHVRQLELYSVHLFMGKKSALATQ